VLPSGAAEGGGDLSECASRARVEWKGIEVGFGLLEMRLPRSQVGGASGAGVLAAPPQMKAIRAGNELPGNTSTLVTGATP
jgi:hypothetical protein